MQNQLTTYLLAGYAGLAVISSEEVRAEAEIATACTSLKRKLHAWFKETGAQLPGPNPQADAARDQDPKRQ